jgi:hypothetical protein
MKIYQILDGDSNEVCLVKTERTDVDIEKDIEEAVEKAKAKEEAYLEGFEEDDEGDEEDDEEDGEDDEVNFMDELEYELSKVDIHRVYIDDYVYIDLE